MARDTRRFGMAIDTRTCVGCAACVIACKTENGVADGVSRDWIRTITTGTWPNLVLTIRSERCNHCEDAPCVTACPTGASYYGPGGTVLVDPDKCTGCKACIAACPYDARFVDPRTGTVDKCTLCVHRLANGTPTTACQEVCPTESIVVGDLTDLDSPIARLLATRAHYTLKPEAGTRPKIFYLS
jgi:Fe-S-cluster-containing dehydrogenase component